MNPEVPLKARAVAASRLGITLAEYDHRIADGEKWCTGCRAWHDRSTFGADQSRPDGLQAACRDARRARPRPVRVVRCACCHRNRPERTGGLCDACHVRWKRAGKPADGPPPPRPAEEVNADRRAALARGKATQREAAEGRREDYRWLIATGETHPDALAARLGVRPSTVETYARETAA